MHCPTVAYLLGFICQVPTDWRLWVQLGEMLSYAAVILPLGLINVIGSMQVIESACCRR